MEMNRRTQLLSLGSNTVWWGDTKPGIKCYGATTKYRIKRKKV